MPTVANPSHPSSAIVPNMSRYCVDALTSFSIAELHLMVNLCQLLRRRSFAGRKARSKSTTHCQDQIAGGHCCIARVKIVIRAAYPLPNDLFALALDIPLDLLLGGQLLREFTMFRSVGCGEQQERQLRLW